MMAPSLRRSHPLTHRLRLEYFLLMVYFYDIYIAGSKIIANSLNKLEWEPQAWGALGCRLYYPIG